MNLAINPIENIEDEQSLLAIKHVLGKSIVGIEIIENEVLLIAFESGERMKIWDNGQQCCESRWIHSDDDLNDFVGSSFAGIALRAGPTDVLGESLSDSQFLIITTSYGQFTVVNYNEHNGYYGGFLIRCKLINDVEDL